MCRNLRGSLLMLSSTRRSQLVQFFIHPHLLSSVCRVFKFVRSFRHSPKSLVMSLSAPLILPPDKKKHSATVIWMHGLGDTGDGWRDVMEIIQTKNPHIKFILPTAPIRPVTINMGMRMPAWYDITDLSSRGKEEYPGIEETRQIIHRLIEEEIKSGVKSERIILGGFSQGGACALYITYQYKKPLGACIVLSGYLPYYSKFHTLIAPENKKTPCLMCHGTDDPLILFDWAKQSADLLQTLGIPIEFKAYEGLVHSSNNEEIMDVMKFVSDRLKPDASL